MPDVTFDDAGVSQSKAAVLRCHADEVVRPIESDLTTGIRKIWRTEFGYKLRIEMLPAAIEPELPLI